MNRNRPTTIAALATAIAGGLAGATACGQAAVAQEAAVHTTATGTAEASTLDPKSALLSVIALGYTEIRSAGRVGDLYQVEAVDTTGRTVRVYMEPDTGVLIKIEKEM
ncbi:MAG: hypothetical protein OEN55_08245 [Alphaproteobacteria bacterium]|nr:hypothetical protein [Alphaproteobacteria bacterium]